MVACECSTSPVTSPILGPNPVKLQGLVMRYLRPFKKVRGLLFSPCTNLSTRFLVPKESLVSVYIDSIDVLAKAWGSPSQAAQFLKRVQHAVSSHTCK